MKCLITLLLNNFNKCTTLKRNSILTHDRPIPTWEHCKEQLNKIRQVSQKITVCHFVLSTLNLFSKTWRDSSSKNENSSSFTHPRDITNLYDFSLCNTKEHILKMSYCFFLFVYTMKVSGHCSKSNVVWTPLTFIKWTKYHPLCFTNENKSCRFGMTWE